MFLFFEGHFLLINRNQVNNVEVFTIHGNSQTYLQHLEIRLFK